MKKPFPLHHADFFSEFFISIMLHPMSENPVIIASRYHVRKCIRSGSGQKIYTATEKCFRGVSSYEKPATDNSGVLLVCDDRDDLRKCLDVWKTLGGKLTRCFSYASIPDGKDAGKLAVFLDAEEILIPSERRSNAEVDFLSTAESLIVGMNALREKNISFGKPTDWILAKKEGIWKIFPHGNLRYKTQPTVDVADVGNFLRSISFSRNPDEPWKSLLSRMTAADAKLRPRWEHLTSGSLFSPNAGLLETVSPVLQKNEQGKYVISWESPLSGGFQLIRLKDQAVFPQEDSFLPLIEATGFGTVVETEGNRYETGAGPRNVEAYLPISFNGAWVRAGGVLRVGGLEEMICTPIYLEDTRIVFHPKWPEDIEQIVIVLRPDMYPESATDPLAKKYDFIRRDVHTGYTVPIPPWSRVFVTTYARKNTERGKTVYSNGMDTECRWNISLFDWKITNNSGQTRLIIKMNRRFRLPAMKLVVSTPQSRGGTKETIIFSVPAQSGKAGDVFRFDLDISPERIVSPRLLPE